MKKTSYVHIPDLSNSPPLYKNEAKDIGEAINHLKGLSVLATYSLTGFLDNFQKLIIRCVEVLESIANKENKCQ